MMRKKATMTSRRSPSLCVKTLSWLNLRGIVSALLPVGLGSEAQMWVVHQGAHMTRLVTMAMCSPGVACSRVVCMPTHQSHMQRSPRYVRRVSVRP